MEFLSGLVWPPLAVSSASLLAGLSIVNKLLFKVLFANCVLVGIMYSRINHVFIIISVSRMI